jgi:uncharacterized protein (DUF486 family)
MGGITWRTLLRSAAGWLGTDGRSDPGATLVFSDGPKEEYIDGRWPRSTTSYASRNTVSRVATSRSRRPLADVTESQRPQARQTTSQEGRIYSSIFVRTAGLLILSNIFMTFAWYAHLRNQLDRPWYLAAIASWGIALFEYLLQVPANRIGYTALSLSQLKILQEVITLVVFAPFAVLYMRQPLKLDYLWAALCLVGAVYFMFRSPVGS